MIERFHLAFRAGLINRFGEIPTASKLAIEFNLRNFQSKPISRESARKWINGQSMPETARLKTLIGWLNLDASFIYSTTLIEKVNIPLEIDSLKDRAKVEAYGRRKIEMLAHAALNFVTPLAAVLNTEGVIILVNGAWRSAAMLYPKLKGGSLGCEGVNYLAVCEKARGLGSEEANKVARSIREVITENTKTFTSKYPCHSNGDKRWFEVKVSAYKHLDDVCCVVTHVPITEATFMKKN
ncbi:hypothetical protein [Polynucleobacter sp.]|uniref:hypothetical protein n=1 Tax=Polynucleobacter sp. TaxID=2029855 RepID=UPI003341F436